MADKKRVMISQPMNGLTNFEIRGTRLAAIAKLEKEGYEVVNSFFTKEWLDLNAGGIKNKELWCLAKSLEIMSSCDTVYFCKDWFKARGCRIEYEAAISYGLEIYEEAVATKEYFKAEPDFVVKKGEAGVCEICEANILICEQEKHGEHCPACGAEKIPVFEMKDVARIARELKEAGVKTMKLEMPKIMKEMENK